MDTFQVGFNAGDGVHFEIVPASLTDDIVNIDSTTNAGQNGLWAFRINSENIQPAGCLDDFSGK